MPGLEFHNKRLSTDRLPTGAKLIVLSIQTSLPLPAGPRSQVVRPDRDGVSLNVTIEDQDLCHTRRKLNGLGYRHCLLG
jgi:hypothetical protein